VLTPFIVKSLGVAAYGFVGLSNNIIGYLQLATIALNSMAGRFVTIAYHKGDIKKANSYFSSVFYANVILSAILSLFIVIILLYIERIIEIPEGLVGDVKLLFGFLGVNFILSIVFNVYMVAPFIKNKLEITSIRNLISNIIRALLLFGLFALCTPHLWYMGISSMVCSVYLVIANITITNKLTPDLSLNMSFCSFEKVKEVFLSGIWNLLGKLGSIIQRGFDLLFANWFINATAMGILSVTTQIPFLILSILGLFSSSFAPSITKDFAKGDVGSINNELAKSIHLMSITIIPLLSVLFIYGDVFYSLWMPSQDANLLKWLTICGTFALIFTSPLEGFWNLFTAMNKIKVPSIFILINSFAVFFTIILLLVFTDDTITKMFIIASVRSVYGVIRGVVFLPLYAARCMSLKWSYYYQFIINPLLGIILTIVVCISLRNLYIPQNWSMFALTSILVAIISLSIGIIVVLPKSEILLLKSICIKLYDKYFK
jgi:O-antigen/teichoic acid export membrane protein